MSVILQCYGQLKFYQWNRDAPECNQSFRSSKALYKLTRNLKILQIKVYEN